MVSKSFLYPSHYAPVRRFFLLLVLILLIFISACQPRISQGGLSVTITVDGESRDIEIDSGSTVQETLTVAGITLGELDRTTPPLYTILADGDSIKVTRIREEFETQQETIPYEHQQLRNESLPDGETRLLQSGVNGLKEITIRHVYENDIEISSNIVRETILADPQPEIIAIGVQSVFSPITIPGKIAYIVGGNAWLMEGSTANRRPVVTTGDLDGRILAISPSGNWLLFSRKSTKPNSEEINTLWVVNIEEGIQEPIDLKVSNVIHYGGWLPGTRTISYSTVEPRQASPGWQANNDLFSLKFNLNGPVGKPIEIVEANTGGVYGWWGCVYAYSPDGRFLSYSRPDSIGFVDKKGGAPTPLVEITPFLTRSDWAWIPPLSWSPDNSSILTVIHDHADGIVSAEESPYFSLASVFIDNGAVVNLSTETGMFAYPVPSPLIQNEYEDGYKIAFLEAIFPIQSNTSRYQLVLIDRDGSNRRVLFPPDGFPGLEPQSVIWSPQPTQDGNYLLAVIYKDNLWMINTDTGQAYQITGDKSVSRIDWK